MQSVGGIGIGLTGISRVVKGMQSSELTASMEEIVAYQSDNESERIDVWKTDDDYFHEEHQDGCVDLRVFQAGWNSLSNEWEIDLGLSSAAYAPYSDMSFFGHKYNFGKPTTGKFKLDLKDGGVYPKDNDRLIPEWVPPFLGPAASTAARSSAPGWLIAGGMALREALGSDDSGYSGLSSNSPGYRNSKSRWSVSPLEDTLSFSMRLEWEGEGAGDRNHPVDTIFDIEGKYKMDTPIFHDNWKGVKTSVVLNPIDVPTSMTRAEREKFGIKRVEKKDADLFDQDENEIPDFIVESPQSGSKPLLDTKDTEKVSEPSEEQDNSKGKSRTNK